MKINENYNPNIVKNKNKWPKANYTNLILRKNYSHQIKDENTYNNLFNYYDNTYSFVINKNNSYKHLIFNLKMQVSTYIRKSLYMSFNKEKSRCEKHHKKSEMKK